MFAHARQRLTRLLLALMLATFLSPTIGWGMVASHDQLAHGFAMADDIEPHHDHGHDHHRPGIPDDVPEHQDAHASIGHLLTHMPAGLFETPQLLVMPPALSTVSFLYQSVPQISPEPPLRPPKADLPY